MGDVIRFPTRRRKAFRQDNWREGANLPEGVVCIIKDWRTRRSWTTKVAGLRSCIATARFNGNWPRYYHLMAMLDAMAPSEAHEEKQEFIAYKKLQAASDHVKASEGRSQR